jgi:hypothetical protein
MKHYYFILKLTFLKKKAIVNVMQDKLQEQQQKK